MEVKKAITVNRSREELYQFWHDFANLPRFMEHLTSVQVTGEKQSHWTAKAPAGTAVEWDAEVVEDRPNELIAWRSLAGASVDNAGTVRFATAPGGRGTEVRVELRYDGQVARLARRWPNSLGKSRGSKCEMVCGASNRCWRPARSQYRRPPRKVGARRNP